MLKLVHPTRKMLHLNEAGQNLIVCFSFAKIDKAAGTVERLHEWAKCRDFLGDVVCAMATKTAQEIYNFRADPALFQAEEQSTQFVIKFPTAVSRDAFLANYEHIVHVVEKENKITLTKITPTSDELVFATEGSKFWQKTVWLISLYSFLLKSSCYPYKNVVEWRKEIVEKGVTESSYMMRVQKNWDVLVSNLKKIVGRKTSYCGLDNPKIHTVHNSCGFVAVLGNPHIYTHNSYCQAVSKLLK